MFLHKFLKLAFLGQMHRDEQLGVERATVGDLSHAYKDTELCTETAI